jgi:2-polyprenyl-3-methyl-5-hydroxy-6-metoxy-1,4-benzoquinol methylase
MRLIQAGDLRIGVFTVGHAAAGARSKIGFQRAIDRGLDAVAVVPVGAGEATELPEAMIESLARARADAVIHADHRAYRTSFLRRVPFWDNTDGRHFDEQLLLQAGAVGAKVVETAPPARTLRDRLSGLRASARYVLHRRGILYSRNFDLVPSGRKYFEKFHDPASSHSRIWAWLQGRGVAGSRVIELGVGDASLTRRLFEAGAIVDGIELHALAADLARPYCRSIVVDDLDEFRSELVAERYDVAIAADVLEHLRDPERILSELRDVLRPDGRLVVSLPNVANLYVRLNMAAGRFPYHTKGILDRTHLHFYTLRSAERMFAKSGWIVRERDVTAIPLVIVFPFLAKGAFRPLMALFRATPRIWKGLFAYQGLFYLEVDQHGPTR